MFIWQRLDLNEVICGQVTRFESLSKFPEVRRDLALTVAEEIAADSLCQAIREQGAELLKEVWVFDVYAGKGIEEGHKSLALGLTLQHPSRTLKDEEVNQLMEEVVVRLERDFNASLRK